MGLVFALFHILCPIIITQFSITAEALTISASIPDLVKLNDGFWLNCTHQTRVPTTEFKTAAASSPTTNSNDGDKLEEEIYAIKWYKDDEEFYRYLPRAEQKVSIYETNGVHIDVSSPKIPHNSVRFRPRVLICFELSIYNSLHYFGNVLRVVSSSFNCRLDS